MAVAVAWAASVAAGQAASFATVHDRARALLEKGKPAEAAKAYGAYAASHPRDPLAPLASIFQGIVLRRDAGDGEAARAAFRRAAQAPDSALGQQLKAIARAWLARLQMEALTKALRQYYVNHVWYPRSLDELTDARLLEPEALVDPWGKRFGYETGRLKWAPDVPRQTCTLTCSRLSGDSRTLEKKLLGRLEQLSQRVRLRTVVPSSPREAIVTTAQEPDKRVTVTAGSKIESAEVAFIAEDGVLLINGEAVAFLTEAGRRE
ncbi:MAG: hypothetical protein ACODAJ_05160 [Planctomycetota bacterium]